MHQESRIRLRDTEVRLLLPTQGLLRFGVIALAALLAFATGMSDLLYPSPYSPLLIGGAVLAAVGLIAWLRKPVWALYAAVFAVLLPMGLISPDIHSLLNRTVTVVALVAWIFDVLVRHRRIHWTDTATLMLAFVAWSALSLIWAENLGRGTTLAETYALRFVLFLFLLPNEIRTRRDLDGLMNTLALNGWLLVAVSVGTILVEGYQPGTRLQAVSMNENEMGIIALVAMMSVLWQTMRPSKRYKALRTLLASVYLLLAIAVVAMSGSRGSAISLVITFAAFCFWQPTRAWGLLGLFMVTLGVASAPLIFSTTLERFAVTQGDTLLGGREAIWQAAWRLIEDHPWRGIGIGNARYEVMPYLRPLRSVWGEDSASIHNPVLAIWAETGITGLVLYLGVLANAIWSFVRQALRYQRSGPRLLMPYFALVSSVFFGYMASWIKGGGMESDFTYFLMLALLIIPAGLDTAAPQEGAQDDAQSAGKALGSVEVPGPRPGVAPRLKR